MNITTDVVTSPCNQLITSLQLDIPWFLITEICKEAKNQHDEFSMAFKEACCHNSSMPTQKAEYHEVASFVKNTCFDQTLNMSEELRYEICNMTEYHIFYNPFEVSLFAYLFLLLLLPIGLLANILIILTTLRYKKLQNATGYMLCNLAFVDLLCIVQMMAYLLVTTKYHISPFSALYFTFSSLDIFIGSASLLSVTVITLERVFAVSKPLLYRTVFTKRRCKKMILSIWLFCFLLGTLSMVRFWVQTRTYEETIFYCAITLSFFIPCLIVITSYLKIAYIAFNNLSAERQMKQSLVYTITSESFKRPKKNVYAREIKLTLNLTIMTIPFVFGWGYFMVGNIYEAITHTSITGVENWFLNTLPFLISCINPLSYIFFTRNLRKQSLHILRSMFCRCMSKEPTCNYNSSLFGNESSYIERSV